VPRAALKLRRPQAVDTLVRRATAKIVDSFWHHDGRMQSPPDLPATLVLPGGSIPYLIRRSPRSRHLRVTIDPHSGVVVSLPPASRRGWARPEAVIESFLRERERWLRRHLDLLHRERSVIAARGGIADGATLRFRGDLHRLRLVAAEPVARRSTVIRQGLGDVDELVIAIARADRRSVATVLRDWFRARAETAIDREIDVHGPALGVAPSAVTLRDPRTRWGSASREGRLSFSWRLVLAPAEALETVVVHELAHLRYFGHGPRFWALVGGRRPDHREWRRWLREHSLELHTALADGR
jgi:predicted metal-dependent hydrolase